MYLPTSYKKFLQNFYRNYRSPEFFLELMCSLKVTVTVKSSRCLQIGFGPLIIEYICNLFI